MLITPDDVNVHLPTDKLSVNEADITAPALDAERLIKGYLSNVYEAATLASWDEPADTPETIRAIAGRLTAAFVYARALSEDDTDVNEYAKSKYDEAMNMLMQVVNGVITLPEVDPIDVSGSRLTSAMYAPNEDSTAPKFTMDSIFA